MPVVGARLDAATEAVRRVVAAWLLRARARKRRGSVVAVERMVDETVVRAESGGEDGAAGCAEPAAVADTGPTPALLLVRMPAAALTPPGLPAVGIVIGAGTAVEMALFVKEATPRATIPRGTTLTAEAASPPAAPVTACEPPGRLSGHVLAAAKAAAAAAAAIAAVDPGMTGRRGAGGSGSAQGEPADREAGEPSGERVTPGVTAVRRGLEGGAVDGRSGGGGTGSVSSGCSQRKGSSAKPSRNEEVAS